MPKLLAPTALSVGIALATAAALLASPADAVHHRDSATASADLPRREHGGQPLPDAPVGCLPGQDGAVVGGVEQRLGPRQGPPRLHRDQGQGPLVRPLEPQRPHRRPGPRLHLELAGRRQGRAGPDGDLPGRAVGARRVQPTAHQGRAHVVQAVDRPVRRRRRQHPDRDRAPARRAVRPVRTARVARPVEAGRLRVAGALGAAQHQRLHRGRCVRLADVRTPQAASPRPCGSWCAVASSTRGGSPSTGRTTPRSRPRSSGPPRSSSGSTPRATRAARS